MKVNPIPKGYHSITPYLVGRGLGKLIEFLKQAFGAVETHPPMTSPDGTINHAEFLIGDSRIMMGEGGGPHEPRPCNLYLYVEDCDAVYLCAIEAGGISISEPADQFYGDRHGGVKDPCGNQWWIGTHIEDVAPEELMKRAEASRKSHS